MMLNLYTQTDMQRYRQTDIQTHTDRQTKGGSRKHGWVSGERSLRRHRSAKADAKGIEGVGRGEGVPVPAD